MVSKTKKVQKDDYYYCYRHHQKPIQLAVFPQACGSFSTSLMYTNIYVNLSSYIFFNLYDITLYSEMARIIIFINTVAMKFSELPQKSLNFGPAH